MTHTSRFQYDILYPSTVSNSKGIRMDRVQRAIHFFFFFTPIHLAWTTTWFFYLRTERNKTFNYDFQWIEYNEDQRREKHKKLVFDSILLKIICIFFAYIFLWIIKFFYINFTLYIIKIEDIFNIIFKQFSFSRINNISIFILHDI